MKDPGYSYSYWCIISVMVIGLWYIQWAKSNLWVVDVLMSSVEGVGSEDCRRRQIEPQKRERRADIKPAGSLAQAVHHNAAWMHATDTYWRLVSSTGYQ